MIRAVTLAAFVFAVMEAVPETSDWTGVTYRPG
jgi:hypothetical protein